MIILLSSALRPRYKYDILRCLAAPPGARLRFRYEARLIEPSLQDGKRKGDAIVCFLDERRVSTDETFLVPIRSVIIENINVHGTTRTVDLRLGDFIYLDNLEEFVQQVYKDQSEAKPKIDFSQKRELGGYWFFETRESSIPVQKGSSVEIWEKIASQLADIEQFKSERYLCAVLGVREKNRRKDASVSFTCLPEKPLSASLDYELLIYHYSPNNLKSDPDNNTIKVTYGRCLKEISPTECEVDSSYDLKQVVFRPVNQSLRTEKTWLRVSPDDKWHLELDLTVSSSRCCAIIIFLVIGCTLALQHVPPMITDSVWLQGINATILAFITAGAAVFGIRKEL